MTEVIPNLYIGNWRDARDCQEPGMTIITAAVDSDFQARDAFPLVDGPGNRIEVFRAAVDATVAAAMKGPTLVHCVGGRSRSAAVVVMAMCRLSGKSFCACYDLLVEKHDLTRIHPHLAKMMLDPRV